MHQYKDSNYELESTKMIQHYINRGYSKDILCRFANQARIHKQSDLLDIKEKPMNNRPILATQCNILNPDMNIKLDKNKLEPPTN